MGRRTISSAADAARYGLMMEVTCPGCGRVCVYQPDGFSGSSWYHAPVEQLAARMICRGAPSDRPGCGRRGPRVRFITWTMEAAPTPPRPAEIRKAPQGIDPEAWAVADERERKRLVRMARG